MGVVDRSTKLGEIISVPMAAEKIEAGELVNVDASGYASAAADASGEVFLGMATETVDNSGGSAGDKRIKVRAAGLLKSDVSGGYTDQAQLGAKCYVYDSETVAVDAADVSNDVQSGVVVQIEGSKVWFRSRP